MEKKKRFSLEQIVDVLRQAEVGVLVAEVIRKAGVSEQTFYRWKAKYAGLEVDQVRQKAQLQEENMRLKRLVADLTLDKTMSQDVLSKNGEAFTAWTDGRSVHEQLWGEQALCLPSSARDAWDISLPELP
ncbi:transposase [Granulicella paludicola]|uniref:transposase n=1 Tax=Granulicella paludicola TaxID=474951 RepID=UPI0037C0738A